jgi:hypothetical protein
MLHACFTPFASCFVYTSWHFYVFSRTNLLMRCHSASSLFSAVLCFRKATQEVFSELDETKTKTSIFPGRRTKTEREPEGSQRGARGQAHHRVARPLARTAIWWGGPGPLLTMPLRLCKASGRKTLNRLVFFEKKSCSSVAATDEFWGTEVSVPAPCRDGEVPLEPSPSVSILSPPSPSTSPPSPSPLLPPMMRRE